MPACSSTRRPCWRVTRGRTLPHGRASAANRRSPVRARVVGRSCYLAMLGLLAVCATMLAVRRPDADATSSATVVPEALPLERKLRWLALAAIPSSLMLGVTTYISSEVAPIPLLWILPLALYL